MLAALLLVAVLADDVPVKEVPKQRLARQVLETAIDEVRRAEAFYRLYTLKQGRVLPFSWVVRQERRHERKLIKVAAKLGYKAPRRLWKEEDIKVPTNLAEACSQAVSHELRSAAIFEQGAELLKPGRARSLLKRLARRTRYKHLPRFEACIRRG